MSALIVLLLLQHAPAGGSDHGARSEQRRLAAQVFAAFDSARGGFVTKSGHLVESAVELAWAEAGEGQDGGAWRTRAEATLRWSRSLLDTLTGGYFHGGRRAPGIESIDKRTGSNARRLELLLRAWQASGGEVYRRDAARLVDWFDRVLVDGRGGFVAAQVGDRELEPEANGHAIHAWLEWAAATGDPARRDFALKSLDRVWEACWTPGLGLVRKNSFGDAAREPLLTDQVEMGRAYLLAARLCARAGDLARARALADLVIERFEERPAGGFRTRSVPKRDGSIQRAKRLAGENARAARFLHELSSLAGGTRYREAAARSWAAHQKQMKNPRLEAADWALALRAAFAPDLPPAPRWTAAETRQEPPRPRVVRIKTGRR
jgi:uncharacterized protein YyaL (SSP411 family)